MYLFVLVGLWSSRHVTISLFILILTLGPIDHLCLGYTYVELEGVNASHENKSVY
jgi:hypothetical protein